MTNDRFPRTPRMERPEVAGNPPPGAPDPQGPQPPAVPPDDLATFIIEGEVVKPDGKPLPKHIVRAFDRALCGWRSLAEPGTTSEARTGEDGRYRIEYAPALLHEWGKKRADLKVEVHDPDDLKLAESPLILQALPREVVNFAIGEDRYRGPDEYTRVATALAEFIGAENLACLGVPDVLILAREAKLPTSSVAYYVKAARWFAQFDIQAEVFYGLLRQNQPTRIDALLARPLPRLWAALVEAKNENIIAIGLGTALRRQLATVQQQYLQQPEHPHTMLLTTTALNGQQQAAFTQTLISTELSGEAFWQALAKDDTFNEAQVTDLRNLFELQSFSDDNTSLTAHLRRAHNVRIPREVAAFDIDTWRDTILADKAVEIPEEILPGEAEPARRAAYARMLRRAAERRYPTPSLAGDLARSEVWSGQPVSAFLTAFPDFEFSDERVTYFLQDHPEVAELFKDQQAARSELLRVEQLFHLTPGEDKLARIQPLWDAGLRSAPQIAALGRQRLMRIGDGLDRSTKLGIYRRAVHITSLALSVYMRFHPRLNRVSPYVIRPPQLPQDQEVARAAQSLPEWETLFGSTDACEVSHNASVLGPPAYLVDIMAFLLRATGVDDPTRTALDELLDRRPDLGTLQLTDENTDTELPQIDLVCEMLEAIAASGDHATLPNILGQTTWDSTQLAAQQEHLEPVAYDVLRAARYPFSLPFDLWLEESRRYLKQMGIARDELMQRMPPRVGVGALEIATESLGMSALERDIIRRPNTNVADLAPNWGIDPADGTLRAQLGPVDILIAQAGIDYNTLLRILNTRNVNPDRFVTVSFAGDPCSLADAELSQADGTALSAEQFRSLLDRLHRFIRLQRRLTWTEYDLDVALAALGAAKLNEPGLFTQLAAIQKLQTTTGLSVGELCSWWSTLSTFAFEEDLPSKYEEAFLNVAAFPDTHNGIGPDLRNDVFALTPDRADLAITASTDATLSKWLAESDGATPPTYTLQPEYSAYLQSATRLTAEDLLSLVETVLPKDATTGNVALNLVNVSLAYRVASFARGLGRSVADVLSLVRIIGMTPLTFAASSAQPESSLDFQARVTEIDEGPFSIQQLAYLLLHDPAAATALAPAPEEMDAWLAASSPAFAGLVVSNPADISSTVRTSITQSLASTLGLDSAVVDALLFTHRPALGNNLLAHLFIHANAEAPNLPTPPRDFHAVFETVHKFAIGWNGLGLDASHLAFVLDRGPAMGWTDITALPVEEQSSTDFGAWQRLVAAAALQTSVFTTEESLFGLIQAAIDATSNPAAFVREDFLAQISVPSGWSLADLTYLTGPAGFNLTLPDMMQDERSFVALRDAFDVFTRSGASAEQAHAWTVAEPTFAEAQSIRQTLMLSYDATQWLDVLAAIQDELRPLRRDALLGYLLHTLGFEDSAAFYQHYLIDPEQAPCARTSRIAEAHAAVQLFTQRILFNLEPFVFSAEDAEGWQWRKNYRVWEAARKVFLYPENWLEPEWRTDKSSFFKDLEDGLSQDDINLVTAERLYQEYLYKLDQVSRLEILGMYEDSWVNGGVDTTTLHVFGRTRDVPQLYYYRRWENRTHWTAWEPVNLDIAGSHLVPIVYNGRLYLFWADFRRPRHRLAPALSPSTPWHGDWRRRSQTSK